MGNVLCWVGMKLLILLLIATLCLARYILGLWALVIKPLRDDFTLLVFKELLHVGDGPH